MMTTSSAALLDSLLLDWKAKLQGWSLDGSLAAAAQQALVLNGAPAALQDLISQWSAEDFRSLPPVVLLSSAEMGGAMGAYAISTGTIYLNGEWLSTASGAQVHAVLTEELGHYLDGLLNAVDTPGDEGEAFSKLLINGQLSAADAQRLAAENDQIIIAVAGQQVQAEAAAPIIRGNSLYTVVNSSSWAAGEANAIIAGGHLASINDLEENNFLTSVYAPTPYDYSGIISYFIGISDAETEGVWKWSDGSTLSFQNWSPGEPQGAFASEDYGEFLCVYTGSRVPGQWGDNFSSIGSSKGIAEIPLSLSITRTGAVKEGAGLFTTSINLTAGTQASGNLANGATVYWAVDGITADDLATGSAGLTGSGTIVNGKLEIQHALKVDADTGEQFSVSVYSDAALTQQIGTTSSEVVKESTPALRANSLYTIVNGPLWSQAEQNSVSLGGHLTAIGDKDENEFLRISFKDNIELKESIYRPSDPSNSFVAWTGLTFDPSNSSWINTDGSKQTYFNWNPTFLDPDRTDYGQRNTSIILESESPYLYVKGSWDDSYENQPVPYYRNGIAEIPLSLSITRTGAVKEGAGLFTTSINLSAGTQTSGNLAEGATVYWQVTGITADDLETSSAGLTGTGVISNGKLDLQHSLKVDGDTGEMFTVNVYSDAARTLQIGTSSIANIVETSRTIRGGSLYLSQDSVTWRQGEDIAIRIGGHLASIGDAQEEAYLKEIFQRGWIGYTDEASEGSWVWTDGSTTTYTNWAAGQPDNASGNQDYAQVWTASGKWDDAEEDTQQNAVQFNKRAIIEIPLSLSITRTGTVREGGGAFTTSINLSAGNQTSGNLAEGAQVWWEIKGITQDDLASGNLTGSGTITNGKLDILHSLNQDADKNENFIVSVYSDAAMTQQIGISSTAAVLEGDGVLSAITGNGSFNEGVKLTAGTISGDPDGSGSITAYKWFKDNVEISGAISSTYDVSATGFGTYKVAVTYTDGQGYSTTLTSADQVVSKIDNAQGTLSAITGNGSFNEGVKLTAGTISGDPEGNGIITGYQWYFNNAAITTNGNSSTYDVSATGFGPYKVAVTYTDGQGYSTTLTSTDQVVAKIDNGNAVVSISGNAVVGSTLTASITTADPDGNGTFTYQWQSFSNNTWSNIANATATSYVLTSNELNKSVRVVVTSTDAQTYGPIAINSTGTSPVAPPPDAIAPTVTSIAVQGTTVILSFSEQITATSVPVTAFTVQTLSGTTATTRTISSVSLDQNDPTKLILTLTGTAPAANVNLRVSYTGPSGDQTSGVVQDTAGNDLASFSNVFATTFSTASTSTIASQYQTLNLTGTSAINGTGNTLNNTISGNSANNTLSGLDGIDTITGAGGNDTIVGGLAGDLLTGGTGTDTFRLALADSLLASYDRITDFVIGTDRIDGPTAVTAANVAELGTVNSLDQAGISTVLTTTTFLANRAASFTYGSGVNQRTYVALNNGTAGFQAGSDAIVEITGYLGQLTNLAIV